VGDGAHRVAGAGVVADEQRDADRAAGPGTLDHRPGLLALDQPGGRVERLAGEVVHGSVAVVDDDSVAPPASAPSIAAFASPVMRATASA